jgi:acetyl-CoA carboxylase biotin carboxyl carrier protein
MDYKAIQELIKTLSDSSLTLLEVESEGVKIKLEKKQEVISVERMPEVAKSIAVEQQIPVIKNIEITQEKVEVKPKEIKTEGTVVTSPIVGTYYASPGPDAALFVTVGSKVKKGQVLCIIEAMKLMNEIESDVDGEIVEILVQNEQMVEYGQPLFRIV